MWCVAELTPQYIRTMEDVLALYEKPHSASERVVCLDEKPVSLHRDVRLPIPAKPGSPSKRDNEYQRCGTAGRRTSDSVSRAPATSCSFSFCLFTAPVVSLRGGHPRVARHRSTVAISTPASRRSLTRRR